VIVEECPNCGAPASPETRNCKYCKAEFFVKTLAYTNTLEGAAIQKYVAFYKGLLEAKKDNPEAIVSLGLCYLQTKLYTLATKCFEKAIDIVPEEPDAYYYYALSIIAGRALKTIHDSELTRVLSCVNMAIQLNDNEAKYLFLAAAIYADYHKANCLIIPPPGIDQLLLQAKKARFVRAELVRLLGSFPLRNAAIRLGIEECL